MDAKAAISKAKTYVADLFAGENFADLGLEEVRFDDGDAAWLITVGFSRIPSAMGSNAQAALAAMAGPRALFSRSYKVVKLKDRDGSLVSITNRSVGE